MKTNRLFSTMLMAALILSCNSLFAQVHRNSAPAKQPTPEQRIEIRVKHMQKNLMLDETTGAKFATLYTEYLTALQECRPSESLKQTREQKLTDVQIEQRIQENLDTQQKLLDIQKKYFQQFKKILNARQLEKVFIRHPQIPERPRRFHRKHQETPRHHFDNRHCHYDRCCPAQPAPANK